MKLAPFKAKAINYIKQIITPDRLQKVLVFVYVLLGLIIIYHVAFARRIIPGVKIGNVRVGSMTYAGAKKALQNYEASVSKKVTLNYNGRLYEIDGNSVGLAYNWDASISRAFEVGRTGDIFTDSKDKLAGLVKDLWVAALYDYDDELFHTRFSQIKGVVNQEPVESQVSIAGPSSITITESRTGTVIDEEALFKVVIASFDLVDFGTRQLPVEQQTPVLSQQDIAPLAGDIKKIVFNTLTISGLPQNGAAPGAKVKTWVLDQNALLDLLTFSKDKGTASLELDKPKFEALLETIEQEVNQAPRGQVTQVDGNRVAKFQITQAGKVLDRTLFSRAFKSTFFTGQPQVALIMKDTEISADVTGYGIFALLGEGNSKFAGSIPGRIHNLALAAERTNGVLVPPGGVYSMNNSIGEVNAKTGYNLAYIIQGGRTVLGEGGGVCQTSTTLFRAVLNAGLPVVMRYPHAYRVYYYEEDSKPGFDASVFQPSLDLQFRNDTPNYILVQSSTDTKNLTQNFKIYGTPDGRSVEISDPIVSNQIAPPETLYTDDPTLAKGITIQTEHATWGATVTFNRTVKRGGEVLHNDTFSSRYQPWRAVFLVGTKQ
jgi:vancomycin resistance protein YoaR